MYQMDYKLYFIYVKLKTNKFDTINSNFFDLQMTL